MNWGYKILSVYIVFIAGILYMVFKSSGENQDLVTKDYYEQELKYQQVIDDAERANTLSSDVTFELKGDQMEIKLPKEMEGRKSSVKILLYCTADKRKDITAEQDTETAMLNLPVTKNNKGLHELKVSWITEGKSYYSEQKLIIP